MADVRRIITQWLETDEALGVEDVPLTFPAVTAAAATPAPAAVRSVLPAARPAPPPPDRRVFAVREEPDRHPPAPLHEESVPRRKTPVDLPPIPAGDIAALPPLTRAEKQQRLDALRRRAEMDCRPLLDEISTHVVFGEGDPDARLLFIGEGPGVEEDKTGRPFVGRSGQLLDKMIAAMGFNRELLPQGQGEVYIANVVKLRCADFDATSGRLKDRPPTPEEAARGLPILHQQIEIIRPAVIVTLGAPAIKWLTGTTEGVMKIRGTWLNYRGIPVMPTYHPSFLLRAYTPENRAKVWSDLQAAMTRSTRAK